jgi:hypothetical protein
MTAASHSLSFTSVNSALVMHDRKKFQHLRSPLSVGDVLCDEFVCAREFEVVLGVDND